MGLEDLPAMIKYGSSDLLQPLALYFALCMFHSWTRFKYHDMFIKFDSTLTLEVDRIFFISA